MGRPSRARLSSPRFRRRLAWMLLLVVLPAVLVAAAVKIGNTGRQEEQRLIDKPAWVYKSPKLHHLTPQERRDLVAMMSTFIQTAVARKDLDRAWPMLGPDLRAGMTRREWNSGNNTVVPYHAKGISALDVLYSYEGDVAFDVSLYGDRSEDTIGKTFTIELQRDPKLKRWLVVSWVPRGVSSQSTSRAARAQPPLPEVKATLSPKWLLVPFAFLSLILIVPLVLGVRSFVTHRRAARRYADELADYRSTVKPS